jgi:ATP-independent RNA helicase DbpA
MLGLSPTGSGKTLAFSLATLPYLDPEVFAPQVLVLCPTRELANQVAREMRKAYQLLNNVHIVSLIGGEPMGQQIKSLKGACHIIVGTPGRIKEHLDKRRLDLASLHTRILDEADRMLEMGMIDDVEAILEYTPEFCRTGLFSATFADHLQALCAKWLAEPFTVDLREDAAQPDIEQHIYLAEGKQRSNGLAALLTEQQPSQCIVFVQTRKGTQQLFEFLADPR